MGVALNFYDSSITNGSDQSLANGWPTLEVVGGCFEDPSGGWGGAFLVATWWMGDGKGNDIEMIQSGAKVAKEEMN